MSALPPLPPNPISVYPSTPLSNKTAFTPSTNEKTDSAARFPLGIGGEAESKVAGWIASSDLTGLSEEITGFKSLPHELVERIIEEGGDFDSGLITKEWVQLALDDHIWKSFADKLGLPHLRGEPGKLYAVVGDYCRQYVKMINDLPEATSDVTALAKGPLNLQKMLKLMEWKANRDKMVIMDKLAECCDLQRPILWQLTTIEKMIENGERFSSWVVDNKDTLLTLEYLSLSKLELNTLPEEIALCSNLQCLDIECNNLVFLPPQIGELSKLIELKANSNELVSLPPQLENLNELALLYLNHNKLVSLPPQIGSLNYLTTLYIDYNKLTSLPREIAQCTSLELLNLNDNELTSLPREIGRLSNLKQFRLKGNLLKPLSGEILELFLACLALDGTGLE